MIGGSAIIAPSGEIVALLHDARRRGRGRRCDLSMCDSYKQTVFNFERHRQIEHYGRITSQRGAEPPA